MAMSKTLEMVFRNENGRTVTLRLPDPKDTLTMAQVRAVMQKIITKNVFSSSGGDLTQIADIRVRSRDVSDLA